MMPEELLNECYKWVELYKHINRFVFACFITLYIVVIWREHSTPNRAVRTAPASCTMPR